MIHKQASLMDLFKKKPWYRDPETVSLIKSIIPLILVAGGVTLNATAKKRAMEPLRGVRTDPKNKELVSDVKEVLEMLKSEEGASEGHSGDQLNMSNNLEASGLDLGQPDSGLGSQPYMYPLS